MRPEVTGFFHDATNTISYIVADPVTNKAVIIDPVLDYQHASGRTSTEFADMLIVAFTKKALSLEYILETHVHADHLTSAPYIKSQLGGQVAIGANIRQVQQTFSEVFNLERSFVTDGSQFDLLLDDGQNLECGELDIKVLFTPGHTPACATYVVGDAAFVGDTLFMPDFGSARCDFPGGDARQLFHSIKRILSLPETTRLFMCHDYAPGGRAFAWETTVTEQRANNIHISDNVTEREFVKMRTDRDAKLSMPALIYPSVQVNVRGGQLPPAEENNVRYLKIPLNTV